MAWTEERIEKLTKLWTEGLTASQIAQELGDVTRNAVIGKAHRLGLSGRPSPVRAARTKKPAASRPAKPKPLAARSNASAPSNKPKPAPAVQPPAQPVRQQPAMPQLDLSEIEAGPGVTLLKVTDKMCKWPIGHPGEPGFRLCGRPSAEGGPYCQAHAELAYQVVPSKRDRRAGAA